MILKIREKSTEYVSIRGSKRFKKVGKGTPVKRRKC